MGLLNLFRSRQPRQHSSRTTGHGKVRLSVERLEGRELPSVSPLGPSMVASNAIQGEIFRPPINLHVYNGPSFQGLSFDLASANGKPAHTLTIQTQTSGFFYTAYITGTWQGDGAPKQVTGDIVDVNGAISITVTWANGQHGTNTLSGTINWVPERAITLSHWHLQGTVTVTNGAGQVVPGAGPGNVSGSAYPHILIGLNAV